MGTQEIDKGTVRRIYALGAALGIKGGGHDDGLHALVRGVTGKENVKALTPAEAREVEQELKRRFARQARHDGEKKPKKKARQYEELPGGPSAGQQRYVWYLMQQIETFDLPKDGVALRYRLCGMVEKMFGVTAFPEQPMRFITARQCGSLIEALKPMAERAELRYLHSPENLRKLEAKIRAE